MIKIISLIAIVLLLGGFIFNLKNTENFSNNQDKIFISLTTIPSRINKLKPIIDSLINQTWKVDKILLNIPDYSLRFKKKYEIPAFLKTDKYKKHVEIVKCKDYGPGTKLLGCINYFEKFKSKDNMYLIIIDDDRIVENNLVENLYKNQIKYKDCVIANKGSNQGLPVKIPWGAGGMCLPLNVFDFNDLNSFFDKHEKNCRYVDDVLWYKFFTEKKIEIKYFENVKLNSETNSENALYKESGDLKRYSDTGTKGLNEKCFEST